MMSSEDRGEERAGENTTEYEKIKKKLLLAIFSNDVEAFITAIDCRKMTCSNRKRVEQVLLHKHSFTAPGEPYNVQMRNILLNLLPTYNPGMQGDHALNACLNVYRGHLIHIAAAMNRASIISKMLNLFRPTQWIGAAKCLLNAKDSEGHTPLTVAVLGRCDDTVEAICECLSSFSFDYLRRIVLNTAAFQSTFQLPRVPENWISMQKLLDKSLALLGPKSGKVLMRKHVCYYWSIQNSDLNLLMAQAHSYSGRDRGYLEMINGLPALHFAVYCYSGKELHARRRAVLEYLIHRPDLALNEWKVRINDVRRFTFKEGLQFSGTAVHFAVYQNALLNSKKFGEEGQQWSVELGPVTRNVMKMLQFLHLHGAQFSQPNYEGRTALEMLPPDSPAQIVNTLSTLISNETREG